MSSEAETEGSDSILEDHRSLIEEWEECEDPIKRELARAIRDHDSPKE